MEPFSSIQADPFNHSDSGFQSAGLFSKNEARPSCPSLEPRISLVLSNVQSLSFSSESVQRSNVNANRYASHTDIGPVVKTSEIIAPTAAEADSGLSSI